MNKKNRILLFLIFCSLLYAYLNVANLKHALAREWEVAWPDLPGMTSPTNLPPDEKVTLNYVVTYVFMFALMILGFVAFLMLIINAIRYMTSTAMPGGKAAAVEQMRNIGFGVLLMLGAYVLLNTINPELTIYGLEEVEQRQVSIPTYRITLYKDVGCTGENLQFYDDEDLTKYKWADDTDVNDGVRSFSIGGQLVARVCHDIAYNDCRVYIGTTPITCLDANAETFTVGAAPGISSIKGEGGLPDIQLLIFGGANYSGDSRYFSYDPAISTGCQQAGAGLGASYWVAENYTAILCQDNQWNRCTNQEIAAGSPIGRPATGTSYESICVYENGPGKCIGALLTNGGNRDFVPYVTVCKLTGGTYGLTVNVNMVGPNCTINLFTKDNCGGDRETFKANRASAAAIKSAGALSY